MQAADLVVIPHERDHLDRPRYFLYDMVERWRAEGMRVSTSSADRRRRSMRRSPSCTST